MKIFVIFTAVVGLGVVASAVYLMSVNHKKKK
jgi:hypothetical protein